jgi:hypothetical protein
MKTFENKGVGHLQTFRFCLNKKNQLTIPKSNLSYLPNGEQLRKCKHTIRIKTFEKGMWGRSIQIPK